MRRATALSIRVLSGIAWMMLPFATAARAEDFTTERCDGVEIYVVTLEMAQASPETIEQQLTIPVENALKDRPGIRRVRSNSWEGRSQTHVEVVRDPDGGMSPLELQTVVAQLTLPASATAPVVTRARCIAHARSQ